MKIIRKIAEIQKITVKLRAQGKTIGLVPTMGALHSAHASLIKKAREENDIVIVSIFVNPAQFGPNEDYLRYPRPFEKDAEICRSNGVDYIFSPSVKEMYPGGYLTYVKVEKLSGILCGQFRKIHFRGVATIVTKLFNITQPHNAYFGEKDFQQLKILEKMAKDLNFPVKIIPCKIIREKDGLAMSSRNTYLDATQRMNANRIYRALKEATAKEKVASKVEKKIKSLIISIPGSRIEYVKICNSSTLEEITGKINMPARVIVAVWVGKTRLIDNIEINFKR